MDELKEQAERIRKNLIALSRKALESATLNPADREFHEQRIARLTR